MTHELWEHADVMSHFVNFACDEVCERHQYSVVQNDRNRSMR